MNEVQRMEHVV